MPDARNHRHDLDGTWHDAAGEMDREIASHRELCYDDLIARGIAPDAARVEADRRTTELFRDRRALHNAARRREGQLRHRDVITALRNDVRLALRRMRRSATASTLTILVLTLGIGLTAAMFTLVRHVLIDPLPFPRAEQLVSLGGRDSSGAAVFSMSSDDFVDWHDGVQSFSGMAAYGPSFRVSGVAADTGFRLAAVATSPEFFRVLQPRFVVGRSYTEEEARARVAGVVIISERLWRELLGRDPALARPLTIGSGSFQVVGVVANGSEYPADADAWIPQAPVRGPGGAMRNNVNWGAIGRLKPGVTVAQAKADMDRVALSIRSRDRGGFYDFGGTVRSLHADVVDPGVERSLRLLMGCVLVVLLIVCANLAITTLGRGVLRQHEMAVRMSLGASRARLVGQLLVEHVMLAAIGGLAGLGLAWTVLRVVLSGWSDSIPRAAEIHLDPGIIWFTAGISIIVGIVAGIIPAVRTSRASPQATLRMGGRTVTTRSRAAVTLVAAEFALAMILMTGAGLLIRSFQTLLSRDLGFNRSVTTMHLVLSGPAFRDSVRRLAAWDRLITAYRTIPSVQHVAVANQVPLLGGYSGFIDIDGRDGGRSGAGFRTVSEDYFATLGIPVLRGRVVTSEDGPDTPQSVVINDAMAKKYWPGQDPIGRRVRARSMEADSRGDAAAPWRTVVGVVGNVRQFGPESPADPEMYVPFRQAAAWRSSSMSIVVRASLPDARILPALRAKTHEVDPHLVGDITTMDAALGTILASRQLTTSLLTGFAVLAMVLAAIGIYAVMSYAVTQRTRELATRAALGARRNDLLLMIVGNGFRTVAVGMTIGVLGSMALSRMLRAMLVDMSALDPLTFILAALTLAVVAFAAMLFPARRAMRLDPMLALRE